MCMYCRAHLSSYLDALESEIAIPLTGLLTCPIRPQESAQRQRLVPSRVAPAFERDDVFDRIRCH